MGYDALSRIGSIVDDDVSSTHLADYSYLGLGPARGAQPTLDAPHISGAIEVDYTEPDIKYTLVGTGGGNDPDTGDIYHGLDRFGRVKDSYWYDYGGSTDLDRIKYGYDRNGNRTWRENTVAASYGKHFDELYDYDLIDRLKTMDRGDLNALKDAVSNPQYAQDWSLDATGNWRNFREDDDGDATWDVNQQRTANKVNQISDISETTGPSWVTPIYNRAGNMTTIPKPADPTASFAATYDAWNRLVKIEEGSDKLAQYEYDAAKRRSVKKAYASGALDETRHFYYTEPAKWQVVEERIDSSSESERQFVWGVRYVDDLVERDRDTDTNGTLDERLYGMQDANWNLTSMADQNGTVLERYAYDAYGSSTVLTGTFEERSSSVYECEIRFAGYCCDTTVSVYQVRNRVLHTRIGAWLQRDPIGYTDGVNLYQYVCSNPIHNVDPTGQGTANVICKFFCATTVIAAVVILLIEEMLVLVAPACAVMIAAGNVAGALACAYLIMEVAALNVLLALIGFWGCCLLCDVVFP